MKKEFIYRGKKFITVKTGKTNTEGIEWIYARLEKGTKIFMGNIQNGKVYNLERTTATI